MESPRVKVLLTIIPVLALLASPVGGGVPGDAPSLARPDCGPTAGEAPSGSVHALTADELSKLLADPAGPSQIVLSPGVYRGDFVVHRSVAVFGQPGVVLEGTGAGNVLTIAASDVSITSVAIRHSGRRQTTEDAAIRASGSNVHLRHVSIEDALFGIALEECKACSIEGAHIVGIADDPLLRGDAVKLWESNDAVVRDSVVEDSRDIVVWYSRRALLEGNYVTRSRYGAHFMYAHDSVVRNMRVVRNVVGIFVMYSSRVRIEGNVLAGATGAAGIGIGFKDSDDVHLSRNWLVSNTVGTYFDSTPRSPTATVTFDDNVVALNETGVRLHASERGVVFTGNDFHENATMVEIEGGGNALGVEFRGNYFSSYEGYDLDGDGRGDVPYEEKLLASGLTDSHPALKLLSGTLAMALIDAASRAVPVLSSRTMLTDASPRMRPQRTLVR